MIARRPMRPTAFTCPAPAIPATSVPKISGAMIILIRRRNNWLNGLKYRAHSGWLRLTNAPATMPAISPRTICWVRVSPRPAALEGGVAGIRGILSRTAARRRRAYGCSALLALDDLLKGRSLNLDDERRRERV